MDFCECTKCKGLFPKTDEFFYFQRGRDGTTRPHRYCKKCNNQRTLELQRKRKQDMVDYKGGKCIRCGYDKYVGALDFHHRDPSIKELKLSNLRNFKLESIKEELDKCDLVCRNCHAEIHGKVT